MSELERHSVAHENMVRATLARPILNRIIDLDKDIGEALARPNPDWDFVYGLDAIRRQALTDLSELLPN